MSLITATNTKDFPSLSMPALTQARAEAFISGAAPR